MMRSKITSQYCIKATTETESPLFYGDQTLTKVEIWNRYDYKLFSKGLRHKSPNKRENCGINRFS